VTAQVCRDWSQEVDRDAPTAMTLAGHSRRGRGISNAASVATSPCGRSLGTTTRRTPERWRRREAPVV
jgi:hypothetical protein